MPRASRVYPGTSLGRGKPIIEANVCLQETCLLNNQHAPEIYEIRVEILGFSQGWMQ